MMKKVILPSGAEFEIQPAPFEIANELKMVVAEELKTLHMRGGEEVDVNLYKDLFCTWLSSRKLKAAIDACLKTCIYNGAKIDATTWQPVEARADFDAACFAAAEENLAPFMKSLYAQFATITAKASTFLA